MAFQHRRTLGRHSRSCCRFCGSLPGSGGLGDSPTHSPPAALLSCPTDLWHVLCPQHPHEQQGPGVSTSCNSHHRESYLTRVPTDLCSHTVSSRTRVARGWLGTRRKGAERGCSSKQGLFPWASGLCTAPCTPQLHFPRGQRASRDLPAPQRREAGRAPRALQCFCLTLKLKLAPRTSVPLLTARECSPRAARLIKTRSGTSLSFFRAMMSFLKKRESWC